MAPATLGSVAGSWATSSSPSCEYAPPGADSLFFDVGFHVSPGEHAALIGVNGVGKSTILRILSRRARARRRLVLDRRHGAAHDPGRRHVESRHHAREMLIEVAPPALRDAGRAMVAAERAMLAGTDDGVAYAARLGDWGDLGGYELEGQWEAAAQRSVKTPVADFADPHDRRAERRRTQAARARRAAHERRRCAAARRARQLPRRTHSSVARAADQVVPVDDPDGQPRPHAAVERRRPR